VIVLLKRNRADLQRAFFPPSFQNAEQFVPRKPGEERAFPSFRVLVEVDDDFLIHLPFREASKVSVDHQLTGLINFLELELAMGWRNCASSSWAETDASNREFKVC
jgi:hypothetical protein